MIVKVPGLYEIELAELGKGVAVVTDNPLELEDVTFEIMLALGGMLMLEDKILRPETVLGRVELLGVLVARGIVVLGVEFREIEKVLLSTVTEEIDVKGVTVVEFSPIVEKELG